MSIADEIAKQMGGAGRLKAMLGAKVKALPKGLGIQWPNKNRSKGNYVEIVLRGDDTYDMTFYNVSVRAMKLVKKYPGVYNDQLVELFEKQTGMYLRLASVTAPRDAADEIRRLQATCEGPGRPTRKMLAQELRDLADKVAGDSSS